MTEWARCDDPKCWINEPQLRANRFRRNAGRPEEPIRPHCHAISEAAAAASAGLTVLPTGDANFWRLMDGDRWVAVIQFNGELMEARQVEIGNKLVAAAAPDYWKARYDENVKLADIVLEQRASLLRVAELSLHAFEGLGWRDRPLAIEVRAAIAKAST